MNTQGNAKVLFGGTFDPVHRAHISCARAVSKALDGATVELLPNASPPHRDSPSSDAKQRLAMLEIACAPYDDLSVNDWELTQSGPSWTELTLRHFRQQAPDNPLILVIGADSYANLDQWKHWQHFSELCHLVVLPRPHAKQPSVAVQQAFKLATQSQTLLEHANGYRLMLSQPNLDVSATAIRHALQRKGTCPALDNDVLAHIIEFGLYNVAENENNPLSS